MTVIYFVRHAQPDFSMQDDKERPLTDEGKNDTKKVLEFFKDKKIDVFYSSPYKRSIDTIASTAEYFGLKIHTDARLREREKGEGGNKTHDIIRKRWQDFDYHEEGGESIRIVQQRNIEALEEILEQNEGKTIVIGTPGTALSTILNYYDAEFGVEGFFELIDWMPYILEMGFEGKEYVGRKEYMHVHKEFKG